MHSILSTLDILREIIGFLDGDKRALVACSSVCWNWFHISTDLLWRTIGSVRELLSLFGTIHFDEKTWGFEKPPGIEEWKSFCKYASKVRHFACEGWDLVDGKSKSISPATAELLRSPPSFVQRPIFPSLQEIGSATFGSTCIWSSNDAAALSIFLGSQRLTVIRIRISDFPGHGSAIVETLYPILRNSLHLRHLSLRTPSPGIEDENLQFVSQLTSLREFYHGGPMNWDLVPTICRLPRLKKLGFGSLLEAPDGEPEATEGWLPQLEELRMGTACVSGVKMLLPCAPPALKVIRGSVDTVECLHELITRSANHEATMEELEVTVQDATIRHADLCGLLQYTNLQHLEIVGFDHLTLDDGQLEPIIKHLPKLRHFSVYPSVTQRRFNGADSRLTLLSLHNALQHCPDIKSIRMDVEATEIPKLPVPDIPQLYPTSECGISFWLGCSRILNPPLVATWLLERLQKYSHVQVGSLYGDDWRKVGSVVSFLHRHRKGSITLSVEPKITA